MATHRTDVDASLYHALREARPDVRPILASKATLVATSHLVEDLVSGADGRHLLMSGFQHGRHWAAERDRYLELSDASDVIAVFAGREPPPGWGVEHIGVRLRAGDPLTQEWFVVALGPEVAVTLCGLETDPADEDVAPDDSARLFEVLWSFDPSLARTAAGLVVQALEQVAPERAAQADGVLRSVAGPPTSADAVAREADLMVAGMMDRVERLRGRERTVERRANEAKTEFLSRMSHELRTPLNAILGFTQLLQLEAERPAADRESLEHIADAGAHLLQLIDEVLDISRIETGRLALSLGAVDARETLREVLALIGPLADARGVRVRAPAPDGPAHVHADAQRLRQVLLNLLSNGVKYNAQGGELAVELEAGPGATVRIAVSDQGAGIPAEELPRLFVPFERLSSTAGAAEGTGLGLALSQRMAQAMGGRIEVASRIGRGSTFTLVLPAAAPAAPPEAEEAPTAATAVPARRRVLHVEDNPSNLRLVERLLAEHADVELVSATRGGDGIASAREHPPDLVLLDLDLPDLPGLEVLRALRAEPATAGVPVVVVSSDATRGAAERLRDAGAAAFITKPLDVRHLLATIAELLGDEPR